MKFFSQSVAFLFIAILSIIQPIRAQNESFIMTQIGPNNLLNVPWDLHYGPDGFLWITEKQDGVVVRVNPETGERDELLQLTDLSFAGGQDGLLGMTFHEEFEAGSPFIYLSYTHMISGSRKQKIVRYTYSNNGEDGQLTSPMVLIDRLPSSDDHQSGRLVFGPDQKLYYTIGDQGVKVCDQNLAQFLPSQQEIEAENWTNYPGKVLRINLDGSIPQDNPVIEGVQSHVYSYGHRNPQGLAFGNNGILYSGEHGPSSDDELNRIDAGKNYGWPYVSGFKDNLVYDNDGCHSNETSFTPDNYQDPMLSLFLPNAEKSPNCTDSWQCRPNIAPSSIDFYQSDSIPNWGNSVLITSLKKGRVYKVQLDATGTKVLGEPTQYFYTTNRYRDIAIDPDGKSFYIITDQAGKTSDAAGMNVVRDIQNPGAILKFTYQKPVSNNQLNANSIFKIWQDRSRNSLIIESNNESNKPCIAELINSQGQVVQRYSNLKPGIKTKPIKGIVPGVYVLNLHDKNQFWQKRIILK